jgi:hypothetical protein
MLNLFGAYPFGETSGVAVVFCCSCFALVFALVAVLFGGGVLLLLLLCA